MVRVILPPEFPPSSRITSRIFLHDVFLASHYVILDVLFEINDVRDDVETLKIKPSLYSQYYAKACNEWRCASPRRSPGQHSFKETLQLRRAIGDAVSDLTGPEIEPRLLELIAKFLNRYLPHNLYSNVFLTHLRLSICFVITYVILHTKNQIVFGANTKYTLKRRNWGLLHALR